MPKNQNSKPAQSEEESKPNEAKEVVKESKKKTSDKEVPVEEIPKEKPTGNKKCLLIAEDERPLAHALELKFAHEGYETHIVQDGAAALEKVIELKPKAILLDLIMPKMDGFAFLEELKKQKINIPVIVLSNLGQDEDQERAKALGAKGYFVKSNTPIVEIVKYVKSVL